MYMYIYIYMRIYIYIYKRIVIGYNLLNNDIVSRALKARRPVALRRAEGLICICVYMCVCVCIYIYIYVYIYICTLHI